MKKAVKQKQAMKVKVKVKKNKMKFFRRNLLRVASFIVYAYGIGSAGKRGVKNEINSWTRKSGITV